MINYKISCYFLYLLTYGAEEYKLETDTSLVMLLKVTVLLALFLQCIGEFERTTTVAISELIIDNSGSQDEDTTQVVSNLNISCCIYDSCPCSSLYKALANLTSNVLLNITTNVMLPSVIPLTDLANITIMGHNNPTVNCNNSGGLLFTACSNCVIIGITWKNCGAKISTNDDAYPVLQLFNSSSIVIENCSFEYSVGQAIKLSRISGDININYCNFLFNTQYKGHGSAIFYSLNISPLKITIDNCKFSHNEGAKSIVHFGEPFTGSLYLQNSEFHHNKAVPIHVSNQDLHISGNVTIYNNIAENGGGIFSDHSNIIFHKNAAISFVNNTADKGGAIFLANHSSMLCQATQLQFIRLKFYGNEAQFGGAIYTYNSKVTFEDCSLISMINNSAEQKGGSICSGFSIIAFGRNSTVTFDNSYTYAFGGGMFTYDYSNVTFEENSEVIFTNNGAYYNGGAFYISHTTVRIKENSIVTLNNNSANYGGAVIVENNSNFKFEDDVSVIFNNNSAYVEGGAIFVHGQSIVIFKENSTVKFKNNTANNNGGALIIHDNSTVKFEGNSTITFNNNIADIDGGAVYIGDYSTVTFDIDSMIAFNDNSAYNHGGGLAIHNSSIIFKRNSKVVFNHNNVNVAGGSVSVDDHSVLTFEGNSTITFCHSNAGVDGGSLFIDSHSAVIFKGNSTVTMFNNSADYGGGIDINDLSRIEFKENCIVTFNNNSANKDSGTMYIDDYSTVIFEENSAVTFTNNYADKNSGALYVDGYSAVTFTGSSIVAFSNNNADNGGAMDINEYSVVIFDDNCTVTFNQNRVDKDGGAMTLFDKSAAVFKGSSIVTFDSNTAGKNGGAMDLNEYSVVSFEGNSKVAFYSNSADEDGGAMVMYEKSTIIFKEKSTIVFYNNSADTNGGVINIDGYSIISFEGNTKVKFNANSGNLGGTIFIKSSQINIKGNASSEFVNNVALEDGGAIYLSSSSKLNTSDNSNISFFSNDANDYGGAIYALLEESFISFNNSNLNFKDNSAGIIHQPVYLNVPKSCNSSCVSHSVYIPNKKIAFTTSSKLILYNPAKCINDDRISCHTYYLKNIMLGQQITLDACVLDYFNQPIEAATEFLITGMNHHDQNYNIAGSKYLSILCNYTTQGISVIGKLHSNISNNFSLIISKHIIRISESKISVKLIIELSRCHLGFWYSSDSQKCECYSSYNIISCSGSNSTIKRGYWFGSVTGIHTVTSCPNDYCNFTCCEVNNGIYHLSPVRSNQCRSHRSGVACGNCETGYTLSFDSTECVNINECTIAQTIMVTSLSFIYWITVVVAVFAMMFLKITAGSLYAIIYYYSVIDILLGQVLFISNGLRTTVNIMSSLAKLTPQFLGQLCLFKNMSGIDQQFIHFVHPSAVLLILIMISVLARRSRRFSSLVNAKRVFYSICLLLLLSYTSVTSTSILLMRSLKFMKVDKLYTYLSPEVEYFHGRHLAYVIVAIICTVVIAIGLPLLLLLEPFLSSKINFVKIKPLLDQFQCCYKYKYRWFAGYYMICRIMIIILVTVKISDDFTTQYLLLLLCALIAIIHLSVWPYAEIFHNIFDGGILQLIVILSMLPMIDLVDNYDETFVFVMVYLLTTLPLASFIAIKLWVNRLKIHNTFKYCSKKCLQKYLSVIATNDHDGDDEEPLVNEFSIVDNNRRSRMCTTAHVNV